jgi:hypothetical protein
LPAPDIPPGASHNQGQTVFEQAFRNIDDALRKEAGCTTELDYTEQTSWLLFLKYRDGLEQDKATEAALARLLSGRPAARGVSRRHPLTRGRGSPGALRSQGLGEQKAARAFAGVLPP